MGFLCCGSRSRSSERAEPEQGRPLSRPACSTESKFDAQSSLDHARSAADHARGSANCGGGGRGTAHSRCDLAEVPAALVGHLVSEVIVVEEIEEVGADAPEMTARLRDPAGNVIGLY
jgi:hypothetical protein